MATRLPDTVRQALLYIRRKPVKPLGLYVHSHAGFRLQCPDTAHDIADLGFQHEHNAVVSKVGVWSVQHEKIGEAGNGNALVGCCTVSPGMIQSCSPTTDNGHGGQEFRRRKAGAQDQRIRLVQGAVGGDDSITDHSLDAGGYKINMILVDGLVPIVGNQNTLAADLVIRDQVTPFVGVSDLAVSKSLCLPRKDIQQSVESRECQSTAFIFPVNQRPIDSVPHWQFLEKRLLPLPERAIRLGQHPRG